MRRSHRWHWFAGLLVVAAVAGHGVAVSGQPGEDFRIIVHGDNAETELSKQGVSSLLLKKATKWGGGLAVEPVDLPASHPASSLVAEAVHGMTIDQLKKYWRQRVFSGRGRPPAELDDEAAVIAHVATTPGAIGYVSASADLGDDVKIVRITGLK